MTRIEQLEKYVTSDYFAYKERSDGNKLTNHHFEVSGGGRQLIHCEWNEKEINSLTNEEFNHIVSFVALLNSLEEKFKGKSFLEVLNAFNEPTWEEFPAINLEDKSRYLSFKGKYLVCGCKEFDLPRVKSVLHCIESLNQLLPTLKVKINIEGSDITLKDVSNIRDLITKN